MLNKCKLSEYIKLIFDGITMALLFEAPILVHIKTQDSPLSVTNEALTQRRNC